MPRSKTTTNHDEIRKWVQSRGGHPATVRDTERGGEEAGLLPLRRGAPHGRLAFARPFPSLLPHAQAPLKC